MLLIEKRLDAFYIFITQKLVQIVVKHCSDPLSGFVPCHFVFFSICASISKAVVSLHLWTSPHIPISQSATLILARTLTFRVTCMKDVISSPFSDFKRNAFLLASVEDKPKPTCFSFQS
mmetsp:Transcript_13186/g.23723  ORF Transcript_13186/g.23723 Transcript_13186/m.23723 type:complete len:119 (+) Transcript_13186:858-1214(+)